MNPCALPELFVKNGFFERRYVLDSAWGNCLRKSDIDSVIFNEMPGRSLELRIHHIKTDNRIASPLVRIIQLK
jgi:hypothetical protein